MQTTEKVTQVLFCASDKRLGSPPKPGPSEPGHPKQDEPCDCERGEQGEGHRPGQHHEERKGLPREHCCLPGPESGCPWRTVRQDMEQSGGKADYLYKLNPEEYLHPA